MELYFYPSRGKTIYYEDSTHVRSMIEAGTTNSYPIGTAKSLTDFLKNKFIPREDILIDLIQWNYKDFSFRSKVVQWGLEHPKEAEYLAHELQVSPAIYSKINKSITYEILQILIVELQGSKFKTQYSSTPEKELDLPPDLIIVEAEAYIQHKTHILELKLLIKEALKEDGLF